MFMAFSVQLQGITRHAPFVTVHDHMHLLQVHSSSDKVCQSVMQEQVYCLPMNRTGHV